MRTKLKLLLICWHFKQTNLKEHEIDFGSQVYPMGSIMIAPVCWSRSACPPPLIHLISFLKFCIKLQVDKENKEIQPEFEKRFWIQGLWGIKCQKLGFLDIVPETVHQNISIFGMMVEGTIGCIIMVPYLGKIVRR